MRILAAALVACLLALPRSFASEEAKDLLKVPPATDRPVADGGDPAKSEPAEIASPDATPVPDTAEAQPEPATSAEDDQSGAEIVPEPYPVSRYALLWENSPFQNESVAPPVESPGLAQRFALSGFFSENGEYIVWVRERATQQAYMVDKKEPNAIGLSLVEVDESPAMQSEASATVRLGGEIGVIKFDPSGAPGAPSQPMAMPPPIPQPGLRQFPQASRLSVPAQAGAAQPGYPIPPQQVPVPPSAPAPGVVPAVPGPPVPVPGQAQVVPGQEQMPPPRVIRRRAIVPAAP